MEVLFLALFCFVLLKGMVFFFVFVFRMLCSFIEDFVCLFVFEKT